MSVRKKPTNKTRQALQQRRSQQAKRNRLLIIGGVILVAIIVVAVLVLQNPARQAQAVGSFVTPQPQNWPNANGTALGPADAKVVVQEYADFQCPYCKDFHDTILPQIISQYVATGKVRFEYHNFIVIDLNTGGNESHRAAEAAYCANDQGKFWDYFNMLFANQGTEGGGAFSDARLKAFAAALGLNTSQFNSCFDSNKYTNQVNTDQAKATALGLNSTPSLIVNGTKLQNPLDYTQVQTTINAAIQKAGQ